jgi:hypothetical protein
MTKVIDAPLLKISRRFYKEYGLATLEDRAIADYRDGFGPVHRRSLWAAHELGLRSTAKLVKSARIVGDCFAAGTLVSTPVGDVRIEDLNVGDKVLTDQGIETVEVCFENPPSELLELTLGDGTVIQATPGQLFFVVDASGSETEVQLKDLKPGMRLKSL